MRTEELAAKALENVNFDKYLLAHAVGKRSEAIANGAPTVLEIDISGLKYTDVALQEIAEGKLSVRIED